MKNIALSMLALSTLIAVAAAQPAEAASHKSKPLVTHSERSRGAYAAMSPSAAVVRPAPYAAWDMGRLRDEAASPPAGR